MHAIVVESADELVWRDVPDIAPDQGEVLIKVAAAGVNRADLFQAAGNYPPPPGASETLGMEVSGTVAALGAGVPGLDIGQEVCALLAGGGYAEYTAVPAGQVMPIPHGISLLDAAGLPEATCTVWSNLVMTAHLSAGQVLLIHGGASGIGTARHPGGPRAGLPGRGHRRSPDKQQLCRDLGADIVMGYRDEDFVARIRRKPTAPGRMSSSTSWARPISTVTSTRWPSTGS